MTHATTAADTAMVALPKGRLIAAGAILALWFFAKVLGPVVILNSDLPSEWKAVLSSILFFGMAKLCFLAIIFVLGKAGFAYLKAKIFGAVGRALAPPREVSLTRYRIGLVMFVLPLLAGWAMPYLEQLLPELAARDRPWDLLGDAIFVASFFVLGGDFWEKCRALFVHRAKAVFPATVGKE